MLTLARLACATADLVALLVFVAIGRSVHDHGIRLAGMATTTWPFAVGLAAGTAVLATRGLRGQSVPGGVVVVLSTVAIGMVLRVVAGQGTAFAFVLVALAFLGALMIGWRICLRSVVRARRRRSP